VIEGLICKNLDSILQTMSEEVEHVYPATLQDSHPERSEGSQPAERFFGLRPQNDNQGRQLLNLNQTTRHWHRAALFARGLPSQLGSAAVYFQADPGGARRAEDSGL